MNRLKIILLLLLLHSFGTEISFAQNLKRATKKYDALKYSEAIPEFTKVLQQDSSNINAWIRLADCYRLTNQTDLAEKCYSRIVNRDGIPLICKYYYAQALLSNGNTAKAKLWFTEYHIDQPSDPRGKDYVEAIINRNKFFSDSNRFIVSKININSQDADFGAVPFRDGIVFASSRVKKGDNNKDAWTGNRFLSLYYAKGKDEAFSEPELFAQSVQVKFNNGPICFSQSQDEMYYTRNNIENDIPIIDNFKVDKLKIYSIKIEKGKYGTPQSFKYNDGSYSCAHPMLSPDGTRLYFTSDMPGSIGGMDIWVCKKGLDGWGVPENAGPRVNTIGNELFPSFDQEGKLYFASNGLPGLGGLDIYSVEINNDGFAIPQNLGSPINSADDDFSFYYNKETKAGYFSSNRLHQDKNDDIFCFRSNVINISGLLVDKISSMPLGKCKVHILEEGNDKDMINTTDDGRFTASLYANKKYKIVTENEFHVNDTTDLIMDMSMMNGDYLSINIPVSTTLSTDNTIVLKNILYDLNKYNIRVDAANELDKLVSFLKTNPKIKIELSSHTDCRASDEYNYELSEKRAKAAVQYLVKHGIKKNRLIAKGYGKAKPVNVCDCSGDGKLTCSEDEHQKNRRTEIKIIN